jgi:glycosyltransferase involved in cell wall biosynthesis
MPSGSPTISIVTPSLNQAAFLEQAMRSVLDQGYESLEYVVADGGSVDGSGEIISGYGSRLQAWWSRQDDGQYAAIERGFEETSGEIMGWLNADDLFFPWTLGTVASIMRELPEVRWLTSSRAVWFDEDGFCINVVPLIGFDRDAFLDGAYLPWNPKAEGWIAQEATFWRRDLWEEAGASLGRGFRLAGDFELWARFYEHADLYATPAALGGRREFEGQRSSARTEYSAEAERALAAARRRRTRRPSRSRRLSRRLRLARVPLVRRAVVRRVGYTAKTVVRRRRGSARWGVVRTRFFDGCVVP